MQSKHTLALPREYPPPAHSEHPDERTADQAPASHIPHVLEALSLENSPPGQSVQAPASSSE
jgi:hypothetical protein